MTNLNRLGLSDGQNTKREDFLEVLTKLAHMLSQPLTSLSGSVEVALMGPLRESEFRQLLEFTLEESNRIAESLEAMREIIEMEASGMDLQAVSWTRRVQKALEAPASVGNDLRPRLILNLRDDIWVMADPSCLDMVTRRLIRGAVKLAQSKRTVRVELSVVDETAYLSVRGEDRPADSKTGAGGPAASFTADMLGLGESSWLIVRRAIDRQGGWLEISRPSENLCCCRVYLPLASAEAVGQSRNNQRQ
jgi:K+-sensing histidine kinase KdpD